MRYKTILSLLTILLALGFSPALIADDDEESCDFQEMNNFLPPDVSGSVNLCAVNKGVRANVRAADLIPGNAYTVWWIYFDDASQCGVPFACGVDFNDFLGEKPLAVLGRLGSAVAGKGGVALIRDEWGGMVPSSGSQIQIFLLDHGPVDESDGAQRARQTLTPEDPFFGMPHHGNAVDGWRGIPVGFTVHQMD